MNIRRRFAAIDIGQIHYYTAGEDKAGNGKNPVCLMPASPFSARVLNVLTDTLGQTRWAFAPDALGQGESCAPEHPDPDIDYFGDATVRLFDALKVERADLYGTHTGAHIALDIAIRHPDRVGRVILDGIGIPPKELKEEYVAHLREAPPFDYNGTQLWWAWHTMRDMFTFFPYYARDAAHRRRRDTPPAEDLHERALDLLQNRASYAKAYVAAFLDNDGGKRYPDLKKPTLLTAAAMDSSGGAMDRVAAMIPDCTAKRYPPGVEPGDFRAVAPMFVSFLDGKGV